MNYECIVDLVLDLRTWPVSTYSYDGDLRNMV